MFTCMRCCNDTNSEVKIDGRPLKVNMRDHTKQYDTTDRSLGYTGLFKLNDIGWNVYDIEPIMNDDRCEKRIENNFSDATQYREGRIHTDSSFDGSMFKEVDVSQRAL